MNVCIRDHQALVDHQTLNLFRPSKMIPKTWQILPPFPKILTLFKHRLRQELPEFVNVDTSQR